ncbi:MAG: V-type ATP synthase subunit E [Halobacteriaceae archaeon]
MSLETVVEDIRDRARARRDEILAEADEEAEEIVAEAEEEAEEIVAEAEAAVESDIEQEREQRLSSAKLEAKQERLEARREALAETRAEVEDRIAALDGDEREKLTRELVAAASEEFDEGATVRIYTRPEDQDLVADILDDYDGYSVAGEEDCLGGLVAESDESRVRVNNTFDSVLEDVWEDELKDVSGILFEEQ